LCVKTSKKLDLLTILHVVKPKKDVFHTTDETLTQVLKDVLDDTPVYVSMCFTLSMVILVGLWETLGDEVEYYEYYEYY